MRRKRKSNNSSTPISEPIVASSNASNENGQPKFDEQTANTRIVDSSIEPKDRSAQEGSQSPQSGRKRRRRRKKSAVPTSEARAMDQQADSDEAVCVSTEPADGHLASEAKPTANQRKRKRRRRKKSSASTADAASAAETNDKQTAATQRSGGSPPVSKPESQTQDSVVKPRVIWPDPKPPNRPVTAENRLAYTPELITEPTPLAPTAISQQNKEALSTGIEEDSSRTSSEDVTVKVCLYCGETRPLSDFLRRTGKKSGHESRRGACRDCRKRRRAARLTDDEATSDPLPLPLAAGPAQSLDLEEDALEATPKRRFRRPPPEPPEDALLEPTREAELRTTKQGTVRMRGRTDKGRRWQQETDLEMARCLVREHAAVVVNRFTIRRLYTNRSFRRYILERDRYTCHFCGEYGDTIDHLLPRAKGGHTTPLNCVCACMLCNQNKADRDLDEFMEDAEPLDDLPADRGFERRSVEQ